MVQEARLTPEPKRFLRRQRVSLLLEATALGRGMHTLRVGSRGFTAGSSPSFSEIAFQDTLNLETSRAAVRTTSDRIMRKIALSEADVPVPASRSFGSKNVDEALDFAQRFKGGVLVKPRVVEPGPADLHTLKERERVREAIITSRGATGRPSKYLVERRIFGNNYTFYVIGGQVVSAVRYGKDGWQKEIYRAGSGRFGQVDSDVLFLAQRAFRALPAMPHGEIRMVCRGNTLDPDRCVVVSTSPHIGLLHLRQPSGWSVDLAERIIAHSVRKLPERSRDRSGLVTVDFIMNEVPEPSDLVRGIQSWFSLAGVHGSVSAGDREVHGTVTATPGQVVTLSGLSQSGKLSASRPQTVALVHARGHS
jgi:hypothetical protein